MVGAIDIKRLLFLDIETVSGAEKLSELEEAHQSHWEKKSKFIRKNYDESLDIEEVLPQSYTDYAGIYAEFGKIICISVGILQPTDDEGYQIRIKSFFGDDEKDLLIDFADMLAKHYNDPNRQGICGHNIKEFDIPYICRRMMIHQIPLPPMINLSGKKPWEIKHLVDTLELWKFGDIKHYTSLDLLSYLMEVPSPKDDIDGSMVSKVYWEDKDLKRIVKYCEKDVVTVANLMLKFSYKELIDPANINIVP